MSWAGCQNNPIAKILLLLLSQFSPPKNLEIFEKKSVEKKSDPTKTFVRAENALSRARQGYKGIFDPYIL
jgi:hypothetical protein